MFRRLSFILLCLLAFSCSDPRVSSLLHDVSEFIEDRPDSALLVLESIPGRALNTQGLQARYSLLYAMALDKNYIDTTDVSIIQPAVRYYEKHGSADERLQAHYYEGIAYFNKAEYDNAIVSFSSAEEFVSEATDKRYVGLLYSRISDLYNRTFNSAAELKYIELAGKVFESGNLDKYRYTTLERQGQALANHKQYDEAEEVFLQLLNTPSLPDYLNRLVKEDYAIILSSRPDRDNQKALGLFRDVLKDSGTLRDMVSWASYAYTLSACGYKKESDQVFSQLYAIESKDYSVIDIWKYAALENEGDYHGAFSLLKKSLAYQDSLVNYRLSQITAKAQVEHMALRNSQLQAEKQNNRYKALVIIIVLTLILLSVIFLYVTRNRKLMKERLELIDIAETMRFRLKESEEYRELEKFSYDSDVASSHSEISSLREEMRANEKTLSALRSEYARMYKSQFNYLGELCESYLLANGRDDSQRIVYNKVQEMIRDISGDKDGQKRFEKMIDASLDKIMTHFREDYPELTENDYRFVSYLFVGFDATTLCIVLKMASVAAVYMKKSRIKKMIQDSQSAYKDRYLEMIS